MQEPLGFALFGRDETHHLFVEAAFYNFGVHVGGEAVFILLLGNGACQFVVSATTDSILLKRIFIFYMFC